MYWELYITKGNIHKWCPILGWVGGSSKIGHHKIGAWAKIGQNRIRGGNSKKRRTSFMYVTVCDLPIVDYTLMLVYHCHKPVFTPKIAIFRRAGMKEGGLPLPLTFQYLIFMIWRACVLNLVMISLLASKWQDFKLRGLQFHFIKQLKNGHSKFKDLLFWSQWRYHNQIQITRPLYHKNQILKS